MDISVKNIGNSQNTFDLLEESKLIANALVDGGLISRENANRILHYQKSSQEKGEILYFLEIILNQPNFKIDNSKILEVIAKYRVELKSVDLFIAHGVLTKELRDKAKTIQREYKRKGTIKSLEEICLEDMNETIRNTCRELINKSNGGVLILNSEDVSNKVGSIVSDIQINGSKNGANKIISQKTDNGNGVKESNNVSGKLRLGEALVKAHFITQKNLDEALKYQASKKLDGKMMLIGEILMTLNMIDKDKFLNFVKTHGYSMRIGELLMAHGLINGEQFEEAITIQKECKKQGVEKQLGDVLVDDMEVVSKERLLNIVAQQKNMERIKPNVSDLNGEIFFLFDKDKMKEFKFVPYKIYEQYKEGTIGTDKQELSGYIITALSETCLGDNAEKIRNEIKRRSNEVKSKMNKLYKKTSGVDLKIDINFAYSTVDEIHTFIDECFKEKKVLEKSTGNINNRGNKEHIDNNGPIKIFNIGREYYSEKNDNLNIFADILRRAIDLGGSDIHIEPQKDYIRVRARIDGALQTIVRLPIQIKDGFIQSIKNNFSSSADAYKPGRTADERINIHYHDKDCDVDTRVSIVPTKYGDKIVCRLLIHSDIVPTIQELGMQPNIAKKYELICAMSNGIIIVTGPTGSGKTTTLHATLSYLNDEERNITTIEDPIEYTVDGINHIDAGRKNGITFEDAVKSILRQDPDILMFGEMRDLASAQQALTAGLTGRLLFTTLHTNDAISAIPRLLDMGIQPFLLGSTLVSIAGQRLVRKICPECKIEYKPEEKHVHYFRRYLKNFDEYIKDNNIKFYKGKGCDHCRQTGYKGRLSIVELFCVNEELKRAVLDGKTSSELTTIARKYGMTSMAEDGICRVLSGDTTIEEVLKITRTNQFPTNKRTVEQVQYLLHGDMIQQEIEDAVYGTVFEKPDLNERLVEVLEEEKKIDERLCGNEEHLANLAESNNRLVSNNTAALNRLVETQSALIKTLLKEKEVSEE